MAAPNQQKAQELALESVAKQIYKLADSIPGQITRRDSHMLNMALAGFKYLILNGKSDAVRLEACKAVIDLPVVRARMTLMADIIAKQLHRQYPSEATGDVSQMLSELLVGHDPNAIRALERAESQILPAKPNKTKETT